MIFKSKKISIGHFLKNENGCNLPYSLKCPLAKFCQIRVPSTTLVEIAKEVFPDLGRDLRAHFIWYSYQQV
jgi:hypothetical protein